MKRKGCFIAAIVFFGLIFIAALLGLWFGWPKLQVMVTTQQVFMVESAVEDFTSDTGAPPAGDHARILEILMGDNPEKRNYFGSDIASALQEGKMVDAWQRPLQIKSTPEGAIEVRSAGPNGDFGDADDVTSEKIRAKIREIEQLSEEQAKPAEVQ